MSLRSLCWSSDTEPSLWECLWATMVTEIVLMPLSECRSNFAKRPPRKLYRIGELVRYTGVSRQTIHNYTIMGLIREARWTEGGHRLYDESVFERLSKISELKKTKSLSQIRQILTGKEASGPKNGHRSQPKFGRKAAGSQN